MSESDEEFYITQNCFISSEVTESDIISEGSSDIEGRFDRLLLRRGDTRTCSGMCSCGNALQR